MSLEPTAAPDSSFNRDVNMGRAPVSIEVAAALLDFLEALQALQIDILPEALRDVRGEGKALFAGPAACKAACLVPLARDAVYITGASIFALRRLNGLFGLVWFGLFDEIFFLILHTDSHRGPSGGRRR